MTKNFRDKIALSGITILSVGLALLIVTFAVAYGFLSEALPILTSQDLVETFGETLAPLIAASIRVMYLGVMGWIGSLVTIRGVTIIAHAPKTETAESQESNLKKSVYPSTPTKEKATPKEEKQQKAKPDTKSAKPEIIVFPAEEIESESRQM